MHKKSKAKDSQRTDYDSPWKQIIEELLEPFLAFFFPQIFADIDFSRGYELKSKELYKLLKDQNVGKRYTDELIKVYLKDGSEEWLLIHIEVQGYKEEKFTERMYTYNYRIFDKYQHEVVSLVVLTDTDPTYKPDTYAKSRWSFEHIMKFPVIKIAEYKERTEELEQSSNPMAILVLAQLKSFEAKAKNPKEKFDIKMALIRMLYKKGYNKKQITELFKFMDWLILLPENLEKEITDEIIRLEEEEKMTYVTHMERIAKKEGKKEGQREAAEKMLKKGFSLADISEITGLTRQEILTLKKK